MPTSQKTHKAERNRGKAGRKLKPKKGKSHKNKGRAERLSHFFNPVISPGPTAKCVILTTFKGFLSVVWQT
jgi:hypothetical protein